MGLMLTGAGILVAGLIIGGFVGLMFGYLASQSNKEKNDGNSTKIL